MDCLNAIALFNNENVKGTVEFHQCFGTSNTLVAFQLYGLKPLATHAIHIHEYGDERKGCKSLGGHFNPTDTTHGSIFLDMPSHAGDLINNFTTDSEGKFEYVYRDPRIVIGGDTRDSILGRSVVIHSGVDDLGLGGLDPFNIEVREKSLANGNAGGRMACAIIGRSKDGRLN